MLLLKLPVFLRSRKKKWCSHVLLSLQPVIEFKMMLSFSSFYARWMRMYKVIRLIWERLAEWHFVCICFLPSYVNTYSIGLCCVWCKDLNRDFFSGSKKMSWQILLFSVCHSPRGSSFIMHFSFIHIRLSYVWSPKELARIWQ